MRIAICDDMDMFLETLHNILVEFFKNKVGEIVVDEFSSGEDFLETYTAGKYDIIILDIEMKKLNGLETAHEIRKIDKTVVLAFHTSYDCIYASDYKVGQYTLIKKEQPIQQYHRQLEKMFAIHKMNNTVFHADFGDVQVKNIRYFKKCFRKIIMYTCTGKHEVSGNLNDIVLPRFIRTHKNYYVNFLFVDRVSDGNIVMTNGEEILISYKYYNNVNECFMSFLFNEMEDYIET